MGKKKCSAKEFIDTYALVEFEKVDMKFVVEQSYNVWML